ncbi:MAG: SAM-dependent methyltransferase [Oscillochloris sp.]|nr:SAM-dependent methyltransferase [Oscillochloris sp.]
MSEPTVTEVLERAFAARQALHDERHQTPMRLFNGFREGCPGLLIDLYGTTAVIHSYADPPAIGVAIVAQAQQRLLETFPWLQTIILKERAAAEEDNRRGLIVHGEKPDRRINEHGVWYALDLMLNQDAGFYLDTRNLRRWILDNLSDKLVLNTFAYTGSLGVAAAAAGAQRVIHIDLNRRFLNMAKDSYTLNGLPIQRRDFMTGDFWPLTSRLRRDGAIFDCVLLDPPLFASTPAGSFHLKTDMARLINKVRPLVADNGKLVVVNNALYVAGSAYIHTLEEVCADGYGEISELIAISEDCAGYQATISETLAVDPAPFNHPTKIAVLTFRRKDGLKAGMKA